MLTNVVIVECLSCCLSSYYKFGSSERIKYPLPAYLQQCHANTNYSLYSMIISLERERKSAAIQFAFICRQPAA